MRHPFHVLALIAALLLCSCSYISPGQKNAPDIATMLHVGPDDAKFFFHAVYDSPDDKPSFGETFRLHVDGDYMGDVAEDEFIEMKIPPGPHLFDVNEISWSGNVISHSTFKETLKPGEPSFIVEHVLPEDLTFLSKTTEAQGTKNISIRNRICNCW